MEVSCGGNTIPTTPNPNYLRVTFDGSLTNTKHLSQLSMKVNARCNLLRPLADTKWGAHFDVLQTLLRRLADTKWGAHFDVVQTLLRRLADTKWGAHFDVVQTLLRRLADTKWGAHFDVLQTSTTALPFPQPSIAQQCGIKVPTHPLPRCSSEQQPLTGVQMYPIDPNLHVTSCHVIPEYVSCY